jgi:hypothetical protein
MTENGIKENRKKSSIDHLPLPGFEARRLPLSGCANPETYAYYRNKTGLK